MASASQIKTFIQKITPLFLKYAVQYKFHIVSFAIAQACHESQYGTSALAKTKNNIVGNDSSRSFKSIEECIKSYYTNTALGKSAEARNATTLDQYYTAFVKTNYCPGSEMQYYSAIKSIIAANKLTQYDAKPGKTLAQSVNNPLQIFLNTADAHSNGELFQDWAGPKLGIYNNDPWCAWFICACAKEAGVLNKLIAFDGSSGTIIDDTVSKYGGKVYLAKSSYTPQPGDIFSHSRIGTTYRTHVGIVARVSGNTVYTYEGNHLNNGGSAHVEHDRSNPRFYQFCHPNWESVGGFFTGISDGYSPGAAGASGFAAGGGVLYNTEYTRADALIREVAYINSNSERTVSKSGIHLSVMNYTTMLNDLWKVFGWGTGETSETSSDTSNLSGNSKTIVDYLMNKGLNAAAACGVIANIYYESSFDTSAVGDNGTSFGVCQWHEGRGAAMKSMAGANWASNLTGQLNYLWHELNTSYQGTLAHLKSVPNTTAGAKSAADYFVRNFEIPSQVDSESIKRQNKAAEYFSQIKSGGVVSDGTMTDKQQKVIHATKTTGSPGLGKCAAWVTNVFSAAGIGNWYGNACDFYKSYCKSRNNSDLKPGMIVAVDSWNGNDDSRAYGHVGIYVGNNIVRHNAGNIIDTSLKDWIGKFQTYVDHPVKWGWLGNVNLTK